MASLQARMHAKSYAHMHAPSQHAGSFDLRLSSMHACIHVWHINGFLIDHACCSMNRLVRMVCLQGPVHEHAAHRVAYGHATSSQGTSVLLLRSRTMPLPGKGATPRLPCRLPTAAALLTWAAYCMHIRTQYNKHEPITPCLMTTNGQLRAAVRAQSLHGMRGQKPNYTASHPSPMQVHMAAMHLATLCMCVRTYLHMCVHRGNDAHLVECAKGYRHVASALDKGVPGRGTHIVEIVIDRR